MAEDPCEYDMLGAVLIVLRYPEDCRALLLGAALVGHRAGYRPVVVDNGLGSTDLRGLGRLLGWLGALVGWLGALGENGRGSKAEDHQGKERRKTFHKAHSKANLKSLRSARPNGHELSIRGGAALTCRRGGQAYEGLGGGAHGLFGANRPSDPKLRVRICPADAGLDLSAAPWLSALGRRTHSCFS